jgi:hypothetical protein
MSQSSQPLPEPLQFFLGKSEHIVKCSNNAFQIFSANIPTDAVNKPPEEDAFVVLS